MKTPDWLNKIVSESRFELEWLDLLSQLEFVGCRKILNAHSYEEMNLGVLKHLFEETSHAFLFKRLAEAEGLEVRSWSDGLFSQAGWEYFERLDQGISALTDQPYAAVSWTIERRVLWLYPLYMKSTGREGVKRVLTQVLAQEKQHAAQFEVLTLPPDTRSRMVALEEKLWEDLEKKITSLIDTVERNPGRWRLH